MKQKNMRDVGILSSLWPARMRQSQNQSQGAVWADGCKRTGGVGEHWAAQRRRGEVAGRGCGRQSSAGWLHKARQRRHAVHNRTETG